MIEDDISEEENFDLEIIELPRNVDGEADGSENPTEIFFRHPNSFQLSEDMKLSKLSAIRDTIDSLESSMKLSRALENEQLSRYSTLRTKNSNLTNELKDADKRNKNMLNLFRRNVTDFGIGSNVEDLPLNLRIQVQRTWHRKYDAMLKLIEELKSEIVVKNIKLEERNKQIESLERKILNIAENLIQREETLKNICTKYLTLKKRKDEQEILLRGSMETLQDALQKSSLNVNPVKSRMTLIPSKEALLARETRRSDRLAHENTILRGLLQEARRGCTCSVQSPGTGSCSSLSLGERN